MQITPTAMTATRSVWPITPIGFARNPTHLPTQAFAGVINEALLLQRQPLIRGLPEDRFQWLLNLYFPGLLLTNGETSPGLDDTHGDEFSDLARLLLVFRAEAGEPSMWLCYAIASAAMGENHLWQDMGLPNRRILSDFLQRYFPTLAAKNTRDMKWKKFFYRQLCEQALLPICKAPHCADCYDYSVCFGSES